jgi:uncharacterized membrane protein
MIDDSRPFSSAEALRFGWAKTMANLKPLLIIGAVGALLTIVNSALSRPNSGSGGSAFLSLIIQVLQVGVTLAFVRAALELHDGRPLDMGRPGELLAGFVPFLLTWVLLVLIVFAGLILLIVPGVIWGLKFGFAPFLVADRKLDPIEALKESSRLTQGVKGQLFVFALLMIGVNLLGAIALGVGLLVTVPTTYIAEAYVLRRLQSRPSQRVDLVQQSPVSPMPPESPAPPP